MQFIVHAKVAAIAVAPILTVAAVKANEFLIIFRLSNEILFPRRDNN